jgi:hypothetical protein
VEKKKTLVVEKPANKIISSAQVVSAVVSLDHPEKPALFAANHYDNISSTHKRLPKQKPERDKQL